MNRKEHLQWCKDRALALLDAGDTNGAYSSMVSDLGKHEETKRSQSLGIIAIGHVMDGDAAGLRKWIEGFN